ncbi:hypothetical protein SCLCIDRAFT_1222430 [Scleroderma citrinum Foug A]|uniref:Uncharacterized protein n=1 Tax=Scleroderma citrinum Foug A TaxID=1036808 RepID=A0A0C3DC54_9AGAM|nr:hypothetical protein SCLCIDRAFT_1222430 [Scleroderma citrinum Foug A]
MYQCIIHGVGCVIVYEYAYFCLQGNLQDVIALGVKQYQDSGTQASIFQDLQQVFQAHANNQVTIQPLVLDIILRNQMSKTFK